MKYDFLVDTYRTERLKTLSVWSQVPDRRMHFRPEPRARTPLEHMVHQCLSEDAWMASMLGIAVRLPALPSQETRLEFMRYYAVCSGKRLGGLAAKPDAWFEETTQFFEAARSRAWVLTRRFTHSAHHREAYALRDLDGFAAHVANALPRLVRSDHTSYVEVNFMSRRVVRVSNPSGPGFPGADRVFEALMRENPVLEHQRRTGDSTALRISDFVTQREFHRTTLYNEFHRRLGLDRQVLCRLDSRPALSIAVGLNRGGRDFSDREVLLVELVRPHLIQAFWNAKAASRASEELTLLRRGMDSLDAGIVVLGPDGRARLVTTKARHILGHFFDGPTRRSGRLPDIVDRWARAEQQIRGDGAARERRPLVVERDGRQLVLRLTTDSGGSVVFMAEQRSDLDPVRLEALGLSRREAQVLAWVAEGKTNAEVGAILSSRPRTVAKHLERIYEKLGVETRTAAAARAFLAR